MKTKILAVTVMSILVIAGLVGVVKAAEAPSIYDYIFLTPTESDSRCPRFSPNGKWIAYHGFGFFKEVVVQRIDDDSMTTTTTVIDFEDYPGPNGRSYVGVPVWTQDGKSIYFYYGYDDPNGTSSHDFIWAVDIKIRGSDVYVIGEPYEVLDGGNQSWYNVENFDISPNGKFLVFWRIEVTRADLYLVPRRPDGTFNIDDRIQLTDTPNIAEYEPRFSPNGKQIAFWSGEGPDHEEPWVEVICIDSHGYPESRRVVKEDASWPFWSPDGRYLGITKHHGEVYSVPRDIWVIDSDTGDFLWEVTTSGDLEEKINTTGDWSPTDWNSIVFRVGYVGIYYAEALH